MDNVADTFAGEGKEIKVVKIDQTEKDKEIGNEGGSSEFRNVADHGERHKYDELEENEPFDVDCQVVAGDSRDECLQVGRGKDNVGRGESDLRYDDGKENGKAHFRSVNCTSNVCEESVS